MRRGLLGLVVCVLVAIALVWRASVTTQPAQSIPANESAHREDLLADERPTPAEIAMPAAPVEREVATQESLLDSLEIPEAAGPSASDVTGELEVTVVARETGSPVAGVSVSLSSNDSSSDFELELETNAGGSVVTDVPADTELLVVIGGYADVRIVVEDEPLGWSLVEPIAARERRRIRVQVMTETLLATVRVLAAEDDSPIAGARIALERWGGDGSSETHTTGSDGSASIELEARILCEALVDADGYATKRMQFADGATAGEAEFVVRLERSASLAVSVLDERGVGLTGYTVILSTTPVYQQDGLILEARDVVPVRSSVRTSAEGLCTFENLPPEVPLTLSITRGHEVVRVEGRPVTLAAGESRAIEIRFGAGTAISGHLLDQHDEPVTGHDVWIVAADDAHLGEVPSPILSGQAASLTALTSDDGSFVFDDVPPGAWWIGPVEFRHDVVGLPVLVVLAAGDPDRELTLRAHRGLFIAGRVVDPHGEPAGDVYVSGGSARAYSDGDGAFRLGPLVPGSHELSVSTFDSEWAPPADFAVEAGTTNVVIQLLAGGSIVCEVRDASGGLARASVHLSRGEDFWTSTGTSSGSAEFEGLLPGTYALVATSSDGTAVARNVVVGVGRATEVSIALAPAAQLTVRYAGESGTGMFEVWSGEALVLLGILATGTSRVCSVPQGALRVALKSGQGTEERRIEARAGKLVEVVFE